MELIREIIDQAYQTTLLEAVAVLFGLLSVWFSMREHLWVYPTGIVSVLIYIYITFSYKLYGDMGINGYYFLMSVYGWYHWSDSNSETHQIPIGRVGKFEIATSVILFAGAWILISSVLNLYTDSDVPFWDALTTSSALVGMWLMARKKIEHWWAWILCDLISVPLYVYKGLPLTAFQFLVFTFLATWGYFAWRAKLQLATND